MNILLLRVYTVYIYCMSIYFLFYIDTNVNDALHLWAVLYAIYLGSLQNIYGLRLIC